MTLVFFIALFIAYILDGFIRKSIYIYDFKQLLRETEQNRVNCIIKSGDIIDSKWLNVLDKAYKSYGINCKFDIKNFQENMEYNMSGIMIDISTGIVFDKKHVSTDEILSGMVKHMQSTGHQLQATDEIIKEKHFVKVYSQDTMEQFVVSDEGMFNSCEKGDMVSITHNEDGLFSVGYMIKERKNDKSKS